MLWRRGLLVAGLALSSGSSTAQDVSAPSIPEANPGRPTVSTPATLTPVGYLQFENGTFYAAGSPDTDRQFSLNQVTKLAVTTRLQLLVLIQPLAVSAGPGPAASQVSGVQAGVQAVALPGAGLRPTVSISYIRSLYNGPAPSLDIGNADNSILLLVSDDFGQFHVDANAIANEQSGGSIRRVQFGQTLSITHPLGRFSITGEIWHFTQPLTHDNAVGNLWAAGYTARKNLVFDAGFNRGLTSTSTRWEGFAGFTYLLPHRLWRAAAPASQPHSKKP